MDNKSKALGYLIGKQIAGMRRVTKEPVAYLYNGVRLPKLPETELPYLVIGKLMNADGSIAGYQLFAFETAKTANVNGLVGGLGIPDKYYVTSEMPEWHFGIKTQLIPPIWANYDILNNDGELYLAASEPIPVYE